MRDLKLHPRKLAPRRIVALVKAPLPLIFGVGVALFLQFVVGRYIDPFYAKVLIAVGVSVLLAVSLNIVNGFTGQFSLGHAGFMALGAYASVGITYYGSYRLWGSPAVHGGFLGSGQWLFVAALLAGGCVAAAAGYIVGLPSLRLRGDYLAIVTLGFGEIVRIFMQQTAGVIDDPAVIEHTPFPVLLTHMGGALGFSKQPIYTSLFWTYVFVALMLMVAVRLKRSTQGRAFLAIRENEIAAEAMGVPVTRYKVRAFVLAAFFAGVAGGLYVHDIGSPLSPNNLGFQKSIDVVIMVVLGGMGSISGSVIAAVVLTVLLEGLRSLEDPHVRQLLTFLHLNNHGLIAALEGFEQYRMIVYALLLVTMMILRPKGLMGLAEFWDRPRKRPRKSPEQERAAAS